MGNVIEKGGEDNFTALDRIAIHLIDNGISVPPIQNDGGHYLPAAIISAINSINMTPPTFSKACSVKDELFLGNTVLKVTVGGVEVGSSGTFYVDINGNITTS